MSPLLKEIKKCIKPKNIRSQYVDMEEIADVFAKEEEEEKAE
ncbi:8932_t:CDS:1, partial [Funneliformis geosporum]